VCLYVYLIKYHILRSIFPKDYGAVRHKTEIVFPALALPVLHLDIATHFSKRLQLHALGVLLPSDFCLLLENENLLFQVLLLVRQFLIPLIQFF